MRKQAKSEKNGVKFDVTKLELCVIFMYLKENEVYHRSHEL